MRWLPLLAWVLGVTSAPGCAADPTAVSTLEIEDHEREGGALLAFTAAGDLALLNAGSLDLLAVSSGVGRIPRDVVYDRWGLRAVTFEADDGDDAGEVAMRPLVGRSLGARGPIVPIDGEVRVHPVPAGLLLFENGYGSRVRLLRRDRVVVPSVPLPLPASVSSEASTPNEVHALVADESLPLAIVHVEAGVLRVSRAELPEARHPTATARLLEAPALGGAVLVEDGPTLTVPGAYLPIPVGAGAARVAAAAVLEGGHVVVIVAEPAQLFAVFLDERGRPAAMPRVEIPGRVVADTRLFTRLLAAGPGRRVTVATSAGLFGYSLAFDGSWVSVAQARGLRAPLAKVEP